MEGGVSLSNTPREYTNKRVVGDRVALVHVFGGIRGTSSASWKYLDLEFTAIRRS